MSNTTPKLSKEDRALFEGLIDSEGASWQKNAKTGENIIDVKETGLFDAFKRAGVTVFPMDYSQGVEFDLSAKPKDSAVASLFKASGGDTEPDIYRQPLDRERREKFEKFVKGLLQRPSL